MALGDVIRRIQTAMQSGQFVNEAAISNGVVLPILHELGWPVFDPSVVAPEFTLEGRRVDFALCHPRTRPVVFVEVKQPGRSEGADRQLFEYAFHLGVPVAVLTDGNEWHFYLPAGQGLYQERRVYKLDLSERSLEESEARLTRYLAYDAVSSGEAHRSAQEDYAGLRRGREIEETIPQAWRKLLEDRDELLVDLVSDQVESLCGFKPEPDSIIAFLQQQLALAQSTGVLGGPRTSTRPSPAAAPAAPAGTPEKVPRRTRTSAPASGATGFTIRGVQTQTRNAKDTLIRFFEAVARQDETFYERFAALPRHGRSRRFLARNREDLYPGRPDLATDYSHQIAPGWWIGTNYGSAQIAGIIEIACGVAELAFGQDVVVQM
jgi:predicted type IV restriction endonuclease